MSAVLAIVLLVAGSAQAFVRLNGNSDFYVQCEAEGSYCVSDSGCCEGLQCAVGNSNLQGMGGFCRRRGHGDSSPPVSAASSSSSSYELPAQPSFLSRSCTQDSDCPAGQCCNRRPVGFRGSLVASCDSDCNYQGIDDLLGDYYSRYYRRAARGKKSAKHHGRHHDEDSHGKDEDKKKKKKASN